MPLRFTIYGQPATAGSKRGIPYQKRAEAGGGLGVRLIHDNKRFASWSHEVKSVAHDAMEDRHHDKYWDRPLVLEMHVYRKRPKSHYRSGKRSHELRPNAPRFPTTKPDLSKILRALEDSLKGVVWRDDSQVVMHRNAKYFCSTEQSECVNVVLWSIDEWLEL